MKVLLTYSRNHFDPKGEVSPSGAGFLAHSIYHLLNSKFQDAQIYYFDQSEYQALLDNQNRVDLFIGISGNIDEFIQRLQPKQSVLFAVNYSALYRRKILKSASRFGFSQKLLTWEDGIHSNLKELEGVTAVITLGNYSNYLSYTASGVSNSMVFPISSSLGHKIDDLKDPRMKFGEDILYFPGGISFRKGVSFLSPIVQWLHQEGLGRKIRILGKASSTELNRYIENLMKEFPENTIWESKWINRSSDLWRENIEKSKFAIFPSFEEGIPASVLDLIEANLPVLYSSSCGLDFVCEEVVILTQKVSDWMDLIRSINTQNHEFLAKLLNRQKMLLQDLPQDLVQFEKIIDRLETGSIWPGVRISESLKLKLPIGSWLHTSNEEIEYTIYESHSNSVTFTKNRVIARTELTTETLISLAITQLDKYVKLEGLTISHFNQNLTIERISSKWNQEHSENAESVANRYFVTTVGEIPISRFPRIEIFLIKVKTRIADVVKYRSTQIFFRLMENPRALI
jgi:hypothetical protein